jgi:hypothetical protein
MLRRSRGYQAEDSRFSHLLFTTKSSSNQNSFQSLLLGRLSPVRLTRRMGSCIGTEDGLGVVSSQSSTLVRVRCLDSGRVTGQRWKGEGAERRLVPRTTDSSL